MICNQSYNLKIRDRVKIVCWCTPDVCFSLYIMSGDVSGFSSFSPPSSRTHQDVLVSSETPSLPETKSIGTSISLTSTALLHPRVDHAAHYPKHGPGPNRHNPGNAGLASMRLSATPASPSLPSQADGRRRFDHGGCETEPGCRARKNCSWQVCLRFGSRISIFG